MFEFFKLLKKNWVALNRFLECQKHVYQFNSLCLTVSSFCVVQCNLTGFYVW